MSDDRRAWEVVAEASEKARDVLDTLKPRRRLGERTLRAVGRRAWERPNVAVSARLFKVYRVADPWDPNAREKKKDPIGLGPVSLRLGKSKRQPAPHLRPKEPKKKKNARRGNLPPGFKPPSGVPEAKRTNNGLPPGFKPPRGVPNAKQTTGYKPPKPPPRPKSSSGEFGGKKAHGLVGKIPVRPDLANKQGQGKGGAPKRAAPKRAAPERPRHTPPPPQKAPPKPAAASGEQKTPWLPPGFKPPRGVPNAKSSSSWTAPEPPKRRTTSGMFGKPREHKVVGKLPMRPDRAGPSGSGGDGSAKGGGAPAPVNRRPPMPAATDKKRRGRFRMTPRTTTTAPVITEVSEQVVVPVKTEEAPPPPKPAARPAVPVTAGGLNDLFGFAAQEGRMRLGSRKKKKE